MRLFDVYKLAVEEGKKADPRRGQEMDRLLKRTEEAYQKLEGKEKDRSDADALWNPYADSRLLCGDRDAEVQGMMWGIDITVGEALLADRLRDKGKRIDAVLGHHPRGRAQASLYKVMSIQEQMMESWGVPITAAEWIMGPRMNEVKQALHSANHAQAVDAFRLLDLPLMCIHTPADLLGQRFMQDLLDEKGPERIKDLLDVLGDLPEYDAAIREAAPPEVLVGDKERRVGRVAVKFAGGTAAPKEIYEQLGRAGVGTIVCMHAPESHIEEARKNKVNLIVASHMASDSLGLNLLADIFEDRGISIIPCSGYIRARRK